MNYEDQLKNPKWQKRRLERMGLADWKCERCGDDSEQLHIHHKQYHTWPSGARVAPWEYEDADLACLCETCHTLTHLDPNKVRMFAEPLLSKAQKDAITEDAQRDLLYAVDERNKVRREVERLKEEREKLAKRSENGN
jgi:hypothetical protein